MDSNIIHYTAKNMNVLKLLFYQDLNLTGLIVLVIIWFELKLKILRTGTHILKNTTHLQYTGVLMTN